MLIPLNLPNVDDKALSIVKINNRYSIALVSVAKNYEMEPTPSYLKLLDSINEESDLYAIFEKRLSTNEDLFKALEDAINVVKQEYL